jgi:hypothetical protein
MQLDPKKYLYDIQQTADLLVQFTAGNELAIAVIDDEVYLQSLLAGK